MKGKLDVAISVIFCAFWTAIVWVFGAITGVLIERDNNRKPTEAEIEKSHTDVSPDLTDPEFIRIYKEKIENL